jgi:hypothetical protein
VKIIGRLALFSVVCACGGSNPPATEPKSHSDENAKPASTETSASDEQPRRPSRVQCDDGSCFACGEAVCLSGFYCAVGKAGHGCAWSPTCSGKPTCGCLAAAMRDEPSCTCEEKQGAIFLVCDGAKL